jgi:hypothetical protein
MVTYLLLESKLGLEAIYETCSCSNLFLLIYSHLTNINNNNKLKKFRAGLIEGFISLTGIFLRFRVKKNRFVIIYVSLKAKN